MAVIDGVVVKGRCIVVPDEYDNRHSISYISITWALKKLNY